MQPVYRSVGIINVSGAIIPPRSIVALSEVKILNGQAYAEAKMPLKVWDELLAVTDGIEIGADLPGRALFPDQIVIVEYNPDDTPAVGDVWGPYPYEHTLNSKGGGWRILKINETLGVVHAIHIPHLSASILVQTQGDHSEGSSQDCRVLMGTKGSEEPIVLLDEETGEPVPDPEDEEAFLYLTVDCYNRFADLGDESQVIAEFVVNGWELTAAACE